MFDLDKEFKNLKERGKPDLLPKMAKITAGGLDRAASQHAFWLFRHPKFRRLLSFESLEQVEQDRIFNELVVINIVLLMLTLQSTDLNIPPELKDYFLLIRDSLPEAHGNELKNLGIEKKFVDIWDKLIDLRFKEYDKDKNDIREAAMELEAKEKELTISDLEGIQAILPVQTAGFGGFVHICRGKTKGKEELLKFLIRHLGRFYIQMRIYLEGNKVPFWKKAKMKIHWFLRDLKS